MKETLEHKGIYAALLQKPGWIVSAWLIVMTLAIVPNWRVCYLRGGPIDDALYPGDPYRVRHEQVQSYKDFNTKEVFPIVRMTNGNITPKVLREVIEFGHKLNSIKGFTVMSPATLPEYQDTGIEIAGIPYIREQDLESFDAETWGERIRRDGSMHGLLVGESFEWIAVTVIPPTDDENDTVWRIAPILEEAEEIGFFQRVLWKTDIYPTNPDIGVLGLGFGRWTIDRTLNFDLIVLPLLGVIISSLLLLIFYLTGRQTLIVVIVSVISAIWLNRASIDLMHWFWPEAHERVYSLLSYANCIVQGTSLPLHLFAAFRNAQGTSSREKFLNAKHMHFVITMIAVMAIGPSLLSIRTLNVWQMTELGIMSSLGVAILAFPLVMLVTPASYLLLERYFGKEKALDKKATSMAWLVRFLRPEYLVKCQIPARFGIPLVLLVFGLASYLYVTGGIPTRTRPLDYIKGTLTERTSRTLEALGSGSDILPISVSYQDPNTRQPIVMDGRFKLAFVKAAWEFQHDLRSGGKFELWQHEKGWKVHRAAAVGSILDKLPQMSRASFGGKSFPDADEEVVTSFYLMDGDQDLDREIKRWSWHREGVRISVFTVINDSVEFRELIERIEEYARVYYPMLDVKPFGKGTFFARVDELIGKGEGWNVLSSIAIIIPLYTTLVWWMNVSLLKNSETCYRLMPIPAGCVLALPFLFSVGLNGSLMWHFDIPLSMSTGPISEMTINAANDFGLFVVMAYYMALRSGSTPQEAMALTLSLEGGKVLLDCGANMAAFLPLWSSGFEPVQEVGWIMQLMLLNCGIGALVIVPSCLLLVTYERKVSHVSEEYSFSAGGCGGDGGVDVPGYVRGNS